VWDPRDQSPSSFLTSVRSLGVPDLAARRLTSAILGHGIHDPADWGRSFQVPRRLSERVGVLPRLTLDASITSPVDGFQKLRFRTLDGLALETVLIPLHKAGAVSVCLSSQVGCAMGCVFCATARMPTRRNLATWEIMGEPFLPSVKPRVIDAASLLSCSYGGQIGAGKITISTVGIVPQIDEYTLEEHKYRLSISLGAATDEKRARLVPVASRWTIAEVMAAASRHAQVRRDRVMLAYVCISGVNVGEDDARALGEVIGDTPVRLDLIDVTDPTGRFHPPTDGEMQAFRDALTRYLGQPVVRRYSGGKEIGAACGTLAGEV
jgi:23S rRNA (adenine2503-C2)-methyltransferase